MTLFHAIFPIELLNTPVSPGHLLLASVEGMAFGAYFYVNLRLCRAGHESIAAVTCHGCLMVLRMDSFLHLVHLFYDIFAAAKPIIFDVHIRTAYGTTNSDIIVA
jgi:hypothetical protein